MIKIIAAMTKDRVIGHNGLLPWRLPPDLKRFRKLTTGHSVLMGRKTFESIGKALPNRINIVATRDTKYIAPGCIVTHDVSKILERFKGHKTMCLWVIGGGEIYQQSLDIADEMHLTLIERQFDGDAFFPEWDSNRWNSVEDGPTQVFKDIPYQYVTLTRTAPVSS